MGFDRINHIIPESLKKAGIATAVLAEKPATIFERLACEALLDLPPESFFVTGLERGTLTVSCRSTRAAYRLRTIESTLLEAMKPSVTRIRLMISTWR